MKTLVAMLDMKHGSDRRTRTNLSRFTAERHHHANPGIVGAAVSREQENPDAAPGTVAAGSRSDMVSIAPIHRPGVRRLLLAIGVILPAVAAAQSMSFEAYYPHRVNQTLVFDYSTAAEGEMQRSYTGTLTRSPAAPETRNGVTYQTVEHATQGLPELFPKRWKTYHRVTEDGLYSGQLNDTGEIEEYLELPASAEPGETWSRQSAFWGSESFARVPRVETAAGTFEDCIQVKRVRRDEASDQRLINTATYCPGLSAVRSRVEHVAPSVRFVTELELVEIRR